MNVSHRGLSRRSALLGAVGLAGAGAAACSDSSSSGAGAGGAASSGGQTVEFFGEHQAGIATPAQDRLAFASFDMVKGTGRAELRSLMALWTSAAARMTAGLPVADDEARPQSPPEDTGEATGLAAGHLTITVGFGPSLFDGRFGLAGARPAALVDIPKLPGDALIAERSGGDLCVQACADDPQVAFHAVRNLRRLAQGTAVLRWLELGFGRTSTTSRAQATPRNLMGFKDGTNNIKSEDTSAMGDHVWAASASGSGSTSGSAGGGDKAWMAGGTYLVARRIRMLLESWDRDFLADQEKVFGRRKDTGAPLGTEAEFDTVPLAAKGTGGAPVIAEDAHIRLAAPATNGGIPILRRGYSYTDGVDPVTGELDAGLFFICFQRDPRTGFIPIQRRLARNDALNEYIVHTASAIFAVPPGVRAGNDYWGRALLA